MTITTCHNPREVVGYLPAVKPTWFFAVPRIWEKLKAGHGGLPPPGRRRRAQPGVAGGRGAQGRARAGREEVPTDLARTVEEADRELFAGLRAMLGLDEAVSVNVGAAPTPREVLVFFHAIGIPLAELWGMSETCGAGACNPPGKVKIGTVGPAGPGVELRLAEDGELLMPLRRRDARLPQRAGQDGRGDRRRRLAAHRRHRARSTRTATSGSSTARRRSSSTPPARTCRRRTSSRR